LIVAVNAAFFGFSPSFANWWLGPGGYIGAGTLALLAIDYTLMSASVVWAQFVLAAGRNPFMWPTLIAGVANLSACIVLAPRFGLVGIAAGGVVAGCLTNYWFAPWQGWRQLSHLSRLRGHG
jgi:O-antigen/teichoic acid export membrane protein